MVAMKATTLLVAATAASAQTWDHSLFTSSPPVYPSPELQVQGSGWEAGYTKAQQFLSNLTLEEKITLVTGTPGPCIGNIAPIPRVGFNGLCLQDGPLAIRAAVFASVFPAGVTVAASFDKGLMYQRGYDMGLEFKGKGSNVALGPVAGPLGRNPLGGRNWEGFSPDPYLTGVAMEQTITGMQQAGTQACAKHYIGNEQETQRNPSSNDGTTIEADSANIDDRTIHELYGWPFQSAVHAGVSSIMCSYNRINGSYGCQNSKTLNGILKEQYGFRGYVMSDWGATHSGAAAINAGLDMDQPGGLDFTYFTMATPTNFGANLTTAVNNGSVAEARLDDMVLRIMTPYFHLGQDAGFPTVDPSSAPLGFFPEANWVANFSLPGPTNRDVRDNHAALIRELAAAGTVLLKNTNGVLPFKSPKNVGVFGNDAGDLTHGLYSGSYSGDPANGDYEFGTLPVGGGSGTGRYTYVVSPLEALKTRVYGDGGIISYVLDNDYIIAGGLTAIAPGPPEVCLVFLKTWAREGIDRTTLEADWNSTVLVNTVAAYCNNTIVITHSGGINTMPWATNPNVTGIVAAHFPGQETGNSIVDILYGNVNPSGRLPYTIAHNNSDYNTMITNSTELVETMDPNAWQTDFEEKLLIDYRYFDSVNKSVLYEFGYGLSYTTFSLSAISVKTVASGITSAPPAGTIIPGGLSTLWDVLYQVTATVTNTGSVAGAAIPQLYVSLTGAPSGTPLNQLRGFEKVSLQPGQSTQIMMPLMRRDVSYWDVVSQQWLIPSGEIGINVGFSSRDFKVSSSVSI